MGESTSPFIDEGDGLTNERERVCMLLSLVAYLRHAVVSASRSFMPSVATAEAAIVLLLTKYGRQSTEGYAHGSR